MARYRAEFSGARRTAFLGFQVTPAEKTLLTERAAAAGAPSASHYLRELCLPRTFAPVTGIAPRNPDAKALQHELRAIGNNLNQLARIANTTKAAPQAQILADEIGHLKAALSRVIAL